MARTKRQSDRWEGRRKDESQDAATAPSPGPKPIVILIILGVIILLFGMLSAAVKVFILTPVHECRVEGPLPDSLCTPGAVFNVTKEQVCAKGYSASVRNVSQDLKDQVYAEYGIAHHAPYSYEIDHIISLELGGSNDITNLYPEAAQPLPGYHEKDTVENLLHKMVCNGSMNLTDAQRIIATNWTVMLNET